MVFFLWRTKLLARLKIIFIVAFARIRRRLEGLFSLKPSLTKDVAHTEKELRQLMTESYKSGEINKNEFKFVNNIFEFDERVAKEIMVPRPDVISISIHDSIEEILTTIKTGRYTRYPVTAEDKDHIIGFLNVKEFLTSRLDDQNLPFDIHQYVKPIIQVIESIRIDDLLVRMQKEHIHIAILFNEYGGTSGLVTVEDIVEEIVGEIRDEFDHDEVSEIRMINEGHFIVNGRLLLEDINMLLPISINHPEVDTIGGWFLTRNLNPAVGSSVHETGYDFTVHESNGRHIQYIEIKPRIIYTDPL